MKGIGSGLESLLLGCAAVLLFCTITGCSSGVKLSEYELLTVKGEKLDTDTIDGQFVFINYWATWCRPCIAEMPSIERLKSALASEGVAFLLISDEKLEKIQGYFKANDYSMTFAKKVLSEGEKEMASFPQTYLIDKEGKVLFHKTGSTEWDSPEMVEKMRTLIAKNSH